VSPLLGTLGGKGFQACGVFRSFASGDASEDSALYLLIDAGEERFMFASKGRL